jgi:hypothetical protein
MKQARAKDRVNSTKYGAEFRSAMINVSVTHRKKGRRVILLASGSYRYVKGEVGYSRDG